MNKEKMLNLGRIFTGNGDAVTCLNCEWKGLVPVTTETCPCCGMSGSLIFTEEDESLHIQWGEVFVPDKEDYLEEMENNSPVE